MMNMKPINIRLLQWLFANTAGVACVGWRANANQIRSWCGTEACDDKLHDLMISA